MARQVGQVGSMVAPGAVRNRARRPSCSALNLADIGEIVDNPLPFQPAPARRETVDQLFAQREGRGTHRRHGGGCRPNTAVLRTAH
jgi:hypothetical protein